ncbi:MAG: CHC2 zinc finger domain-containing protein, partial [Opitutaceae bacterium]
MAMIPEEEIEKLKREVDIAAVIRARGIELKPSTKGSLVGRCPFHDDTHPSLSVTPGKGLFRCMSSECGKTGNVIMFVQWFDGISWRHAFELLKNGAAFTGAPTCAPVKKSTVPKLASPLAEGADDQAALRQVLDYYHARLKENPDALAYLQKRGITAEAIATFKVGFVDRTLGLRLPQKNRAEGAALRARLARLGVMRETGHEHFRGRVVFPVVAESGEVGTIYGRAINKVEKDERHCFLAGPLRGVWNPAALRSAEVIVTEGIIDALAWWCAGYRHVTTAYSAKRLPDELLDALLAAKVKRVFLSFDRDASGDTGAATVAAQLAARGIEVYRVMFPPGYDANRYALEVTPPEKSLGVLLRSALPMGEMGQGKVSADASRAPVSSLAASAAKAAPVVAAPEAKPDASTSAPPPEAAKEKNVEAPAQPSRSANDVPATAAPVASAALPPAAVSPVAVLKHDDGEIVLVLGEREWRVRGLGKNAGFESLKVTLRVAHGERWHMDNFDLCLAQKRAAFVTAAAVETLLKPELVKRDLGHVLQKLEELQEARLKAEAAPKKSEPPPLSALLRAAALALLRDPQLLDRILADFARCGVVGEETNKLVGYLAAVSRLLEHPLAVIIQSSSAAGKTTLMDMILSFMPPEVRLKYSAMTGQSLFYMGGVDLRHKILAIVEEEGAEKASYALKLLQSEHELRIASTGKNPQTGRMETQEYHVQGPTQIFLTTTSHTLDEELQNRCLVLTVDESREQTERIHALQREARTEAGLARKAERAALLELHRAAQSLLVPLPVFNPYAEKLRFLSHQLRTRRDHEKYQLLIDSLAVLFQYQRERKTIAGREHVVATLD